MNTKKRMIFILTLVLLAAAALVAVTWAGPELARQAGGAPEVVAYQGEVRIEGTPYNGDGYFKFAVVNAPGDTTYWSNDGTSTAGSPPAAAVQLAVGDGLFGVLLGDTSLGGMSQPLAASVFAAPDRYLRVWFSASSGGPFEPLSPDTRIAAVPYALQAEVAVNADTVDGLHAHELQTHYENVVVVAKSGGDYTSVQAAIDSITDAAADNAYLVWVAPGVYEEQVTLKPYVHLQGAGQAATIITSDVSDSNWPATQGTLLLATGASLRDLTVENTGSGDVNVALLATVDVTGTQVADVTAQSLGGGVSNNSIVVAGPGAHATLQQVTALAENGTVNNVGLVTTIGASALVHGGTFTARGGERARAALVSQGATLEAEGVAMLAEDGSDNNTAMYPYDGAEVVLQDGTYTARGGLQTNAVADQLNSRVTAHDITVLAENGVTNYGIGAYDGSVMIVRGADVTARGGDRNYAVGSEANGAVLDAESVTGLAEGGAIFNYGLYVAGGSARATVRGGSFIGRGGQEARGILNDGYNVTLEAVGVTALGENCNNENIGLSNQGGAVARLRGGSYTGHGVAVAGGIYNNGSEAILDAEGITVLGNGATSNNYGLFNEGGEAVLRGGSFSGLGGTMTYGIINFAGGTLKAESVTALAENASDHNHALYNHDGTSTTLHGGSFTGRGGTSNWGINTSGNGTTLLAVGVTALGEDGTNYNVGLDNYNTAQAIVHGGSFTGRGGTEAKGIHHDGDTLLEAVGVTALAEDASSTNQGLDNNNSLEARLRGGSFTGLGGVDAYGIRNNGGSTLLDAVGITALGDNGSNDNYGLYNLSGTATADSSQLNGGDNGLYLDTGTVSLGVSQLIGGAVNSTGTLTCFQVYDGSYAAYTCP